MRDHYAFTLIIALRFALAAPNLQTEVLFLTSNVSVNGQSGFL